MTLALEPAVLTTFAGRFALTAPKTACYFDFHKLG